jgi:serine/threonine protein kinase
MLCKKLPFNERSNSELYKKIIEGKFNISKHISKEAQDLLKKIIKVNPEQRIKIADLKKHPWFKLANINSNIHCGLNPKEIVFPIDEEIINNMSDLGFNKMEVRYNIIKNEHNNITTTYYLLLNKKLKVGRKSIADLHSELYDDYINDSKNKIRNYKEGIEEAIKERIYSKGILEIIPDFEQSRLQKKRPSIKLKRNSIQKNRKSISSVKENRDSISNVNIKIDILNKPKINSNSVAKNR